ncbi:MAG: acyl-CoA synthetase [Alphaproteobacteria bacterium]|nr:acyl-CoA synthetase [Alphaproteobacteria bacterium]
MLTPASDYQTMCQAFRWEIPERFNIATAVCDRWADGTNRPGLIQVGSTLTHHSFDDLKKDSNRLANLLRAKGVRAGDRVAILLGQRVETLLAHFAAWKLQAITVPLFSLFGPEALAFRLADSGAVGVITDAAGIDKVSAIRDGLPDLKFLISTEPATAGALTLGPELERASDAFEVQPTLADDPALIIYTSGTTGPPKGALHAHRVLLGHLPGVQWPHDFFPRPCDRFWTPADWAWIGGLFDVLMPSLYFGVPVVASRAGRFEPDRAIDLMIRHEIKNVFMPPTALRLLRQAEAEAASLDLRTLASGGERLGDDVIDWGKSTFGLAINEFYGQTEANLLVGNNAAVMPTRSGSMGRPIPGHDVAILDGGGNVAGPGVPGEIAARRPDPVMFLGYWNNEAATSEKFRGDWMLTGDLGVADQDGYITYQGRADDIINSAGYRIGPAEIEECLTKHPAVALAAAIGVPDAVRGEVVKACLVLRPGNVPSDDLAEEIRTFVKRQLAAHEYPRQIEFLDELPLTATGKVMRRALRGKG